jgi:hypothetical protein
MINTLPRCEVLFIGTERKVDRNGLANMGFKAISLKGLGIKGKSPMAKIKAILFQPVALFQAARIIRKFRPDLVFGVGGYISGPVILARAELHPGVGQPDSWPDRPPGFCFIAGQRELLSGFQGRFQRQSSPKRHSGKSQ